MIEKILTLSTAHLPADPDFGDLRAIPFEYGFVVWVEQPDNTMFTWLYLIMEWAWDEGCSLVMFDRDGEVSEDLPRLSW